MKNPIHIRGAAEARAARAERGEPLTRGPSSAIAAAVTRRAGRMRDRRDRRPLETARRERHGVGW